MEQTLATIISRAAAIREESWNDTRKVYDISMIQACKTAAQQSGQQKLDLPVYLLLVYAWDDALAWAQEPITIDRW